MQNHRDRPEVRSALASGRGMNVRTSATTGNPYVYVARTLSSPGGEVMILRLAEPLEQLSALRTRLAAAMALAILAAGVAILFTSLWLDRRLFEPASRLISGAQDLAIGRVSRVTVPDEEELAPLALALNRLAATAEQQVEAVSQERDHLQEILASMSEGVLVVDRDGRAQMINPAFYRLFDLVGDFTGRPALEIIRHPGFARRDRGHPAPWRAAELPDRPHLPRAADPAADQRRPLRRRAGGGRRRPRHHRADPRGRHAAGLRRQRLPRAQDPAGGDPRLRRDPARRRPRRAADRQALHRPHPQPVPASPGAARRPADPLPPRGDGRRARPRAGEPRRHRPPRRRAAHPGGAREAGRDRAARGARATRPRGCRQPRAAAPQPARQRDQVQPSGRQDHRPRRRAAAPRPSWR